MLLLIPTAALAQYNARITQVDRSRFPTIGLYVSITDVNGNPLSDALPVELSIFERGQRVHQTTLVQGQGSSQRQANAGPASLVLVLDVSGSMSGEKLQKAKEAASAYVDLVPPTFQIAVISFDDTVQKVADFTRDKRSLRAQIQGLATRGSTALQDAIATALDMLRNQSGRRAAIALTDGEENASRQYTGTAGYQRLLQRAADEGCSISTIGLGQDVKTAYLKGFEVTGGWYLFSPGPQELRGILEKMGAFLRTEWFFQYTTPFPDSDGTRRDLAVVLRVAGQQTPLPQVRYVSPGVIPNVRGNHAPYLVLLLALLFAPSVLSSATFVPSVYRFRASHVMRLRPGSPHLGRRDPNVGPAGQPFTVGDLVVQCPHCQRPHSVRSWRLNRCHCMQENQGRGYWCYSHKFPRWLRRALHFLSGAHQGETGCTWLCRCSGDQQGY